MKRLITALFAAVMLVPFTGCIHVEHDHDHEPEDAATTTTTRTVTTGVTTPEATTVEHSTVY
jgi:PBP1b-binding outer membrane lipoprotein LpoB